MEENLICNWWCVMIFALMNEITCCLWYKNLNMSDIYTVYFVQSFSHVQLFATPRTTARQPSLAFTISQSLLKLMSIESVMPSSRLALCYPLLLLRSFFPSIGVFSAESALCIRWPKYWSFRIFRIDFL